MTVSQVPRGVRAQIALLGRCNTGKSSLLNCITGQISALVAPQPGTTADPVAKAFELPPWGPVTFYDTAGLDEPSQLGLLRREASRKVSRRADLALLVTDQEGLGLLEKQVISQLREQETPFIIIFNKKDQAPAPPADLAWCREQGHKYLEVSALDPALGPLLRQALLEAVPERPALPPLCLDLVPEGGLALCVIPIDESAPAGRLITPQAQVLRELVEFQRQALILPPEQLIPALARLNQPPHLVITDSQALETVVKTLPAEIPLTTFSLLFARQKGDYALLLDGAQRIPHLRAEDRILVAEACSHHPQCEDIGRVKLPRLLNRFTGRALTYEYCGGEDFPEDLEQYKLVLHCGGCMLNRREMQRRLRICRRAQTPVTNYGMAISLAQGVLRRMLPL